jgi:hypothetical protein
MPTATERARLTAEDVHRMDAEDKLYDEPGVDWEEIFSSTEPDRLACRMLSMEEFIYVSLQDANTINQMTASELHQILVDNETGY